MSGESPSGTGESLRSTMTPNSCSANRLTPMFWAAALAALFLGGCVDRGDDEMTKGVVSGERPVAMEGSAPFFGGKVIAKVTVSRGVGKGLKPGGKHGGGDKTTYDEYANSSGKQTLGSPLPPVTLHLILTNTGAEEISVRMIDFTSELGNFVVDPETVKIPPGQTAEPTPMVSQLGVNADELPFTVRLELANAKEERTVMVRNLLIPAKPGGGP
jgi:hypothetical protein